jgi:hypothetical protein
MAKGILKNYSFNTSAKTITLTDITTVRLDKLALITDVTTNKILYNFADSSVSTASVATNVITLSALQGGENNTDKLRIDYDIESSDTTAFADTTAPVSAASLPLPSGASTAANQSTGNTSLASIVTNTANIPASPATSTKQDTGNTSLGNIDTSTAAVNTVLGAKADNKSSSTDTTAISIVSILKQISSSIQAAASSLAGTLTVASHAVTNAGTFAVQATEADGANTTLGAKADAKSTATDTTAVSAMSVWKQISASAQAIATSIAGTLTVATHAVTQSGTWTVQPGNTPNSTPWLMQLIKKDTFAARAAFTITLNSLASSAAGVGRQSTLITGNTSHSALISVKFTVGTTPTINTLISVYLIRGDGTTNDDNAGASDAGLTVVNAPLLGTILVPATTSDTAYYGLFDTSFLGALGPTFGIAIVNSSGVTSNSTGGNFSAAYTLIT